MFATERRNDSGERRLALLAAALAAIGGVQLALFPIWFAARGLGPEEIATLLAAAPAARIVSNLLGTTIGDRRGDYGRLILFLMGGTFVVFAAMDLANGFLALFAGHTILCFVQGPIGPLFDGLVLGEARRRRGAGLPSLRLETMRSWSAASVLVFMLASGPVASARAPGALIDIMAALALLSFIASLCAMRGLDAARPRLRAHPDDRSPLRRPGLVAAIIAAAAIVHGSHGFLTAFGSLHWTQKGMSPNFVVLSWGATVFGDFLFYLAAARWFGGEKRAVALMVVGAAGAVGRWLIFACDPGPWGIIAAQFMQMFSGAALTLGPAYLVAELGGKAYTARVHGWLAAACGLALSVALYFSGPLEAAYGQRGYLAMAAMAAIGLAASVAVAAATRNGLAPTQPLKDDRQAASAACSAFDNERLS